MTIFQTFVLYHKIFKHGSRILSCLQKIILRKTVLFDLFHNKIEIIKPKSMSENQFKPELNQLFTRSLCVLFYIFHIIGEIFFTKINRLNLTYLKLKLYLTNN